MYFDDYTSRRDFFNTLFYGIGDKQADGLPGQFSYLRSCIK